MTERASQNAASRDLMLEVYRRLMAAFGPQDWWPGAEEPLEVCIGAILAQNTAWRNAERALERLKDAGVMSTAALAALPVEELTELLRPSGTFRSKSLTVQAFVAHLGERYQGDLAQMLARPPDALRTELLGIRGIGPETADDILLYAVGKAAFVVDGYTRRILYRLGLAPEKAPYSTYSGLFTRHLPADPALYNEYHALMVRHAKEACRKDPLCHDCCLLDVCPAGKRLVASGGEARCQPHVRHL